MSIKIDDFETTCNSKANVQTYYANYNYSNAELKDENMADITDWTDGDTGTGDSSQVTFDSKTCMKLNSGASTGGIAQRYIDVGTYGTRSVISISLYHDAIGTRTGQDQFILETSNGTTSLTMNFASDGLFVYDGSSWNEVGINIVSQDTWQSWSFDINWTTQTVDIYSPTGVLYPDIDCSYTGSGTNGLVTVSQQSDSTANRITYIDWFKAGATFTLETASETSIKTQGSYALKVLAKQTNSLNINIEGLPLGTKNLGTVSTLNFDMYSSRTGSNIRFSLYDSTISATCSSIAPNITTANEWQQVTWDISGVVASSKSNIGLYYIKVINADEDNTFYLDNFGLIDNLFGFNNRRISPGEGFWIT